MSITLLATAMALCLSLTSCADDSVDAYATMNTPPTMNFVIEGSTVDATDSSRGIPGLQIEVTFDSPYY